MKKALITGITGQDNSYLAALLKKTQTKVTDGLNLSNHDFLSRNNHLNKTL